jgi:hypothetical protein
MWNDGTYLAHHGIKGQRWGIRRYQNFDGSYTKAGLERYRKSEENYNKKKESYKTIRSDSSASSYEKRMAKAKMKEAKRQMDKDYKHLAQDKKADKGKLLYREGKRITTNNSIIKGVAEAATLASVGAEYAKRLGYLSMKDARTIQLASVGITAATGLMSLIAEIPNNQLRAYYSHTSNY